MDSDPLAPPEIPEQAQMWDAYGHALGAAAGLEFTMRIALWDAIRTKYADDPETAAKVAGRVNRMTFGGTSKMFQGVYTGFGANPKFVRAMEVAVSTRNQLAHHFLDGRMDALKSDEGVELVTFECRLASAHSQDVEFFIQKLCPADFKGFLKPDEPGTNEYVAKHPLREQFMAYRRGEIDGGELIKIWQRMEMGDIVDRRPDA